MITDKDVAKLKKTFVTRDEFKSFSDLVMGMFREQRKEMNERFDLMDKRFDTVMNHLDGLVNLMANNKQEHDVLVGHVDRHDRWINQIADNINTKLEY